MNSAVQDLKTSIAEKKLVAVIGAGVSLSLASPSKPAKTWTGLIKSGLEYAALKARVSSSQLMLYSDLLSSEDMDDLLGAAEFLRRKLDSNQDPLFERWLQSEFEDLSPENMELTDALKRLSSASVPIVTTNYDTLLERVTSLPFITIDRINSVMRWSRREESGILHLHGVWNDKNSCVLGIRDYESAVRDDIRTHIQRAFSSFNRLLFIGCGDTIADPNFRSLIEWMRINLGGANLQHYALVRNSEVAARHGDAGWAGFIDPVGYGDAYSDLASFISNLAETGARRTKVRRSAARPDTRSTEIIAAYQRFIVKDCGQMTVEGVRADIDTSQRKFDLERLFVPLDVSKVPPEIAIGDPDRDEKLAIWRQTNPNRTSFGEAFATSKQMALLALPGGGKTLLLKRVAVAYADPDRRRASTDGLPDLDLTPIMIRCREWKDHITKPLAVLLQSLPQITGEASLEGLAEALVNPLKQGKVILLVDGLDEIHNDADRTIFVENLEKFLIAYPKTRLLVTSREAGFDLVAPCLVRFCDRWKIASLSPKAIALLSDHWHTLMHGGSPESIMEAQQAAADLLRTDAVKRLAENPLLLTMLLVVKHGNGRLPPDRVSLYELAVAILLDTWNIKGHEPLKLKESIPQLACLAYELLRAGKQTATEREILDILEKAREALPVINRYAKDSPHDFLKRVELRSSLLMESGHTLEGVRTVPFYQFRHLTFQEYLAAVAAAQGHYLHFERGQSVLYPLQDVLLADEWKEVVPMAATLAGQQAEPILRRLVDDGLQCERDALVNITHDDGSEFYAELKMPSSVNNLLQALISEADFPPDLIDDAARLVAFFAGSCSSNDDWKSLATGPYGADVVRQALSLYVQMPNARTPNVRNSCAILSALSKPDSYYESGESVREALLSLNSTDREAKARTLLIIPGHFWKARATSPFFASKDLYLKVAEQLLDSEPMIWGAATWAFGFFNRLFAQEEQASPLPSGSVLVRLEDIFFGDRSEHHFSTLFAISAAAASIPRDQWIISLPPVRLDQVRHDLDVEAADHNGSYLFAAAFGIAYHARDHFTDQQLIEILGKASLSFAGKRTLAPIGRELGIDLIGETPEPIMPSRGGNRTSR